METKFCNLFSKLIKSDKKRPAQKSRRRNNPLNSNETRTMKARERFETSSKGLEKGIFFYTNKDRGIIDIGKTKCLACDDKYNGPVQYKMCPSCRAVLRVYFPELIGLSRPKYFDAGGWFV